VLKTRVKSPRELLSDVTVKSFPDVFVTWRLLGAPLLLKVTEPLPPTIVKLSDPEPPLLLMESEGGVAVAVHGVAVGDGEGVGVAVGIGVGVEVGVGVAVGVEVGVGVGVAVGVGVGVGVAVGVGVGVGSGVALGVGVGVALFELSVEPESMPELSLRFPAFTFGTSSK
jgi:hypothetical protein